MQPHRPPVPAELERRLARLELTLLEVVTAVGMLVGELALREDLVLTTPPQVEAALEQGWQALVGVDAIGEPTGVVAIGEELASGRKLAEAGPEAIAMAVQETRAAVGALYAIEDETVRLVGSVGYPGNVMEEFAEFSLAADLPAATAARAGRAVWFGARTEIVDAYPHLREAHEETEAALGQDAVQGAVVPLVNDGGDIVAVAIIGFTHDQRTDDARRLDAVRERLSRSLRER